MKKLFLCSTAISVGAFLLVWAMLVVSESEHDDTRIRDWEPLTPVGYGKTQWAGSWPGDDW